MKRFLPVVLLASGVAHADGARIAVEFESEKDRQTGIVNHAITFVPGWEFGGDHFIRRVELLVEHNRDTEVDSTGSRATENKLFVRLRHEGDLTEKLGYYVRGGAGRSFNNERDFNYAYVEPGLEYKLGNRWEGAVSYRDINSIDNTSGHRVRELRIGPSFEIDKHNEIELRYVKGNGDKDLRTWVFEYVYKQ